MEMIQKMCGTTKRLSNKNTSNNNNTKQQQQLKNINKENTVSKNKGSVLNKKCTQREK